MPTVAQAHGERAEDLVDAHLRALGWTILARRLRVGRLELDLVGLDPGPPARLVVIEVRWRARRDHGLAEETVDATKRSRLRVAAGLLVGRGRLPDGQRLPRLPLAIDLVTVEPPIRTGEAARIRHHRDVLA
jgi:Holliday junction resolvase-like predicted endonuclease